jgi:hypothetical protein
MCNRRWTNKSIVKGFQNMILLQASNPVLIKEIKRAVQKELKQIRVRLTDLNFHL